MWVNQPDSPGSPRDFWQGFNKLSALCFGRMQRVWNRLGPAAERYRESSTRLSEDSALEIVVGMFDELKVDLPAPEVLKEMAYTLALGTW